MFGLTLEEILQGIPTDPLSIFVYLLLAVSAWLVWLGSRPRKGPPPPAS